MTSDEGAYKAMPFFSDMAGVREFEEQFEKLGPLMFGFHDGQCEAPKVMAKRVKDFYWGDKPLDKDIAQALVDAISDSSYAHPIDTAGKIHSMTSMSSVYFYHFGYKGQFSLTKLMPNKYPPTIGEQHDITYGVGNGDDLIYLFPIYQGIFRPLQGDDLVFSNRLVELLATFARTGKPEIAMGEGTAPFRWDAMNPNNLTHLDLGNLMEMDQGLPNHR